MAAWHFLATLFTTLWIDSQDFSGSGGSYHGPNLSQSAPTISPLINWTWGPVLPTNKDNPLVPIPIKPGPKPVDTLSLDLVGKYHWQLLYDIDNTNNTGPYKRTYEFVTSMSQSYSSIQKETLQRATSLGMGVDASGVLDVVKVGFKANVEHSISSAYESTVEQRIESNSTRKTVEEFNVGPHSRQAMYRLIYSGPGVNYASETVSTSPKPMSDVIINFTVKQKPLLKDIKVVYSDTPSGIPNELLEDSVYGKSDINLGFNGQFVWLVPIWTTSKNNAATSFKIAIQSTPNPSLSDLASGAGGQFRYLIRQFNAQSPTRITRVGLLRGRNADGALYSKRKDFGWDECTTDMNEDRGLDYLYVCWNNIAV